jgi:transposase
MDTQKKRRTRRKHSAEVKRRVLAECAQPGASVAGVAMAHGINANIVHCWRKLARQASSPLALTTAGFVPVSIEPQTRSSPGPQDLVVELQSGAVSMKLTWPLSRIEELASWTREVLR